MFDKKLLPASRLCGLMEMAEQTWLGPLLPQRSLRKRTACQSPSRSWSLGSCILWGTPVGCLLGGGAWGSRWREERGFAQLKKKSPLTQADTSVLAFPTLNYTRINLGLEEKPHRLASAPDPPHHDQGQGQAFVRWFFPLSFLPQSFNSPVLLWSARDTNRTHHVLR